MSAKYILKLLTLGESQVGKSSILFRYSDNKFLLTKAATIGIDMKSKIIKSGNEKIKVSIYDTAGQERFRSIIKNYYKGANGVLLVYDITKRDTFKKLDFWLEDLKNNSDDIDNLFIFLVGNKSDLEENREVSLEEANEFAKSKKLPYMEVSAKSGKNVKELFEKTIKGAMIKLMNKNEENNKEIIQYLFIDKEEKTVKNKRCC